MKLPLKIIVVGIIALIIFLVVITFAPGTIKALNEVIQDLGVDTEVEDFQTQMNVEQMFELFVNDYKVCKASSDVNCICDFSGFSLPEGYYIEIQKQAPSNTKLILVQKALVEQEDGRNVEEWATLQEEIIYDDALYFPKRIDMHLFDETSSHINLGDSTKVIPAHRIRIKHPEGIEEYSFKTGASPLEVDTSMIGGADLTSVHELNSLLGLLKLDKTNTLMEVLQTRATTLYGGAEATSINIMEQQLSFYSKFRKCNLPETEKLIEHEKVLDVFLESYSKCVLAKEEEKQCQPTDLKIDEENSFAVLNREENLPLVATMPTQSHQKQESHSFMIADTSGVIINDYYCLKYYGGDWYWAETLNQISDATSMEELLDPYACSSLIKDYSKEEHPFEGILKTSWDILKGKDYTQGLKELTYYYYHYDPEMIKFCAQARLEAEGEENLEEACEIQAQAEKDIILMYFEEGHTYAAYAPGDSSDFLYTATSNVISKRVLEVIEGKRELDQLSKGVQTDIDKELEKCIKASLKYTGEEKFSFGVKHPFPGNPIKICRLDLKHGISLTYDDFDGSKTTDGMLFISKKDNYLEWYDQEKLVALGIQAEHSQNLACFTTQTKEKFNERLATAGMKTIQEII